MNQLSDRKCPLCGLAAQCEDHVLRHLRHYRCDRCTEFVIKYKAEAQLQRVTPQVGESFAAQAKAAPEDMVLYLSLDDAVAPTVTGVYRPLAEALHA